MSKIRGKLAVLRDSVGKIIDVSKRGEELPEKKVIGKFAVVRFPIIKRGVILEEEGVIHKSEEE